MLAWAIPAAGTDGGQAGHGVDDVGIEVAQDVVAAPGELAGDGDGRQLAVVTVLHRGVVGVVGTAPVRGVHRRFEQRPPQRRRPLAGQVAMGAVAVGGVDGDVQAAVAHDLLGTGEASAVAELGPHRHGDQPADPVVGLDQRPARRLAMTEAL